MGSSLNITFYAEDSILANQLALQCFKLADSLNDIFSDYIPQSELNHLSSTAGKDSFIKVSPLLFDILLRSKKAWQQSYHAFDVTIGPLSRLWRKARKSKIFPGALEINKAKSLTGFDKIVIDTGTQSIKLLLPGMQFDLGGIAKGYVAQKIIDYLKLNNIDQALADAGGDIAISDSPPDKEGWHVGINIPEEAEKLLQRSLIVHNKSVATSGDAYQFIEYDGKKYSHIINPKTGYGVTFQRNVTVIADDGATADWLASACSILSIHKAKNITRFNNAALLITYLKNKKIKFRSTKNFKRYWFKN